MQLFDSTENPSPNIIKLFNMDSRDLLLDATRWQLIGRLDEGRSQATSGRDFWFREIWCPPCENSSQRQDHWSTDLVKTAKRQQGTG
ncbi:hypothetical protein TNCV_827481 [Trichonephila clavipes]|nr:hypothetical protein TNCV_827481 [Trichonephila clavipes]